MRLEGSEGVVGDLGPGRRDAGDERALAHVGEADQSHVGPEEQLEVVPRLLAAFTLLGEGRCPPPVGEEAGVPPSAAATVPGQPPVARGDQVAEDSAVAATGPGAHRDRNLEVGPIRSVTALAAPVAAIGGPTMGMVAEPEQRRLVGGGHQPYVAAPAAVAAVGAAPVDVGLTPKGHRAGSAVARLDVHLCLVDEPGHSSDPTDDLVSARLSATVSVPGRLMPRPSQKSVVDQRSPRSRCTASVTPRSSASAW